MKQRVYSTWRDIRTDQLFKFTFILTLKCKQSIQSLSNKRFTVKNI